LCVSDTEPRVWTEEELDLLEDLATLAATEIQLRSELITRDTLNEQLQSLERLKTDMLRVASHDLRNPLSIIFGYLSLLNLDEDQFSETYNSYFHFMNQAAQKIRQIVDDIILMQNIEKTESAPLTDDVSLTELTQLAYSVHTYAAKEKNIHFDLMIDISPMLIKGNRDHLQRAINSMINNAIKFTPENGAVQISLYSIENAIRFEVIDNGIGIAEEFHEYIFKPFSRIRSRKTADIEGTGLGLYMAKCIISRHNGNVFFSSALDVGSTFGFELNSTFVI
jgi:signal transduction histidine kinase